MSTQPAPSVARGDILLQPAYFTSSLFVNPLREDISALFQSFTEAYNNSDKFRPFQLFKELWTEQGWTWMHFKTFDARGRERFYAVTLRCFAERMVDSEPLMTRVLTLFGLYTFFFSQPSSSFPPLHSAKHIALPIDVYESMLNIPSSLTDPDLLPLQPYATHLLSKLLDAQVFHILPHSSLQPQNPSILPREICVPEGSDISAVMGLPTAEASSSTPLPPTKPPPKKKGRPSKREKAKRARDAVNALDKWIDKSTVALPSSIEDMATPGFIERMETTHTLIAHAPSTTRNNYSSHKQELLDVIVPPPTTPRSDTLLDTTGLMIDAGEASTSSGYQQGKQALMKANEAVLTRLRKIDEMAAEKGLEVGGEGGEMTGLSRVEKAVNALKTGTSRGGILDLLEGVGTDVQGSGTVGDVREGGAG